jgi:hypothetical protein
MVSLHVGWLDVFNEVGPMLELVEVDRAMGTWLYGQVGTWCLSYIALLDKIARSKPGWFGWKPRLEQAQWEGS